MMLDIAGLAIEIRQAKTSGRKERDFDVIMASTQVTRWVLWPKCHVRRDFLLRLFRGLMPRWNSR
jgi:hypothetical protein